MNTDQLQQFIKAEHNPVSIKEVPIESTPFDDSYRSRISIDVIHDGVYIPPGLFVDKNQNAISEEIIQENFIIERDWGANLVAARIAQKLGLGKFCTVETARCLMDFGRFPGSTREGATHLSRFAINQPFSSRLGLRQKRDLLRDHYDIISDVLGEHLQGKLLKIAVHTYDRYNHSGTERPEVSLVTRSEGYQKDNQLPFGVFDPLFPHSIGEFTVDRILRDRISLTLEKNRIPVAHNYPYLLPDGSVEVRHQVWSFFAWLQEKYSATYPGTIENEAYIRVWDMLLDTNLRSAQASAIRSILHMYRNPPRGTEVFYDNIVQAYMSIKNFMKDKALVEEYKNSPSRAMSFGIEVRKDLLWEFNAYGEPVRLKPDRGLFIADKIAEAITIYLCTDREAIL